MERSPLPAAIADLLDLSWVLEARPVRYSFKNHGKMAIVTLRATQRWHDDTDPFGAVPSTPPRTLAETWWLSLIKAVFIIVFLIANVLLALWVERRGLGRRDASRPERVAGLHTMLADARPLQARTCGHPQGREVPVSSDSRSLRLSAFTR